MDMVLRQSLGLILVSVLFVGYILRLSRGRRLSYRYTVGWLFIGVLIAISVIPLQILESTSEFVGLTPVNMGLLILGVVVLAIAVQLSVSASHLAAQQRTLGMHQALSFQTSIEQPKSNVLVVIPALNEADSVGSVVDVCREYGYACLVIDDGSSDHTGEVATRAGATVLTAPFNLGIGVALRAGFIWAVQNGYEKVVQCDADGQHAPEEIRHLLEVQEAHLAHLVVGSRFAQINSYPVGRLRWLVMQLLAKRASKVTRTQITDASSGFRCIANELLKEFAREYPMDYMDSYEALIASGRANYRVVETFTPMKERSSGVASNGAVRAAFHTLKVLSAGVVGTQVRYQTFVADRAD